MRRAVMTAMVLMFGAVASAPAQAPLPAKPQAASLDSEAPKGAPPHWLPNEPWVMQHWLPYDEERLHRLLRADRGTVWRWLRDDTRSLAQLAQERGWDPAELARELVAPWKGRLRDPRRLALLERRALRTLTQGHLAQHVFFHSLHQDAVPDNAPAIFGTATRAHFQALRRSELSPLQICRLNGLSGDHARREAERTLRRYVQRAVDGQAMPASQGRRLLARQLRQLPRWLNQTRYNGPPPVKSPRASAATASNYSNNAVLSADGAAIAYESYDAKLADAKRRGEIGVLGRDLTAAASGPFPVSVPRGGVQRAPRSSYNPSISADGRWVAFESAQGNLNFAKRYGKMAVYLRDTRRGDTRFVARTPGGGARSTYSPSVSGDGHVVAYESSEARTGTVHVHVTDVRSRRTRRIVVPGALLSEPALSGDGRYLAVTGARAGEPTRILRRDLRSGRTVALAPGDGDAFEPSISRSGRFVAFTSLASDLAPGRAGRQSRVFVHDAVTGRTTLVAPRPGDGLAAGASAAEPAISGDGRSVAFTVRTGAGSAVHVHDLGGRTELVSRAATPAMGESSRPSISADGRRVAFTSSAWNLSPEKCNAARGIFVRDRDRASTALVSRDDGENRYLGPTKGSSQAGDMTVALVCS